IIWLPLSSESDRSPTVATDTAAGGEAGAATPETGGGAPPTGSLCPPAKPAVGAAGAAPPCSWTRGAPTSPGSGATVVRSSVLSSLITQRLLSECGQHSSAPVAASWFCGRFWARPAGPYRRPSASRRGVVQG